MRQSSPDGKPVVIPRLSPAEIEERVRQRLSAIFGLPPDDEEIGMLAERALNPGARKTEQPKDKNQGLKKPVLNSFHFEEGLAFSAETKLFDEQKAALKKRRQAFLRQYLTVEKPKLVQKSVEKFNHPRKPPACARGYVNKLRARSSKFANMDLLFMEGQPPGNPAELYGEGVRVISLASTPTIFATYRIPCLPYRVYGTSDYIYYLYGEEALKKYKGHKGKSKKRTQRAAGSQES